jgi:hypothetical protein
MVLRRSTVVGAMGYELFVVDGVVDESVQRCVLMV